MAVLLPSIQLAGTSVTTSTIGYGCAGLFQEPDAGRRRRILEEAYSAGIRHFDLAPMYGMGRAETEFGRFASVRRGDLVIATKFGLDVTALGRGIGYAQRPVRLALSRSHAMRSGLQRSAANPDSGRTGQLLYRHTGFTGKAARQSLHRSLRALQTDYVDLFLLHDPPANLPHIEDVCETLDAARTSGTIRAWGVTGEAEVVASVAALADRTDLVAQVRRDELMGWDALGDDGGFRMDIVYGVLTRAVSAITSYARADPTRRRQWSEAVGADCASPAAVAPILISQAARKNRGSVVLFSTVQAAHIQAAVQAAVAVPQGVSLDAFESLVRARLVEPMECHDDH